MRRAEVRSPYPCLWINRHVWNVEREREEKSTATNTLRTKEQVAP